MARLQRMFDLTIVVHHGHRLFFNEKTGRATAALEAGRLPEHSLITLYREGRVIGSATRLYGSNESRSRFFGTFCGHPPLVHATNKTRCAMQSLGITTLTSTGGDPMTLDIRASGTHLQLGDRIRIELGPMETRLVAPANWSTATWLGHCTEANRDRAVKRHIKAQADEALLAIERGSETY